MFRDIAIFRIDSKISKNFHIVQAESGFPEINDLNQETPANLLKNGNPHLDFCTFH